MHVCVLMVTDRATCRMTDILVEISVEDPCWFYKSDNPVFLCTVHSTSDIILWKRDNVLLGLDSRPIEMETTIYIYEITSNIINDNVRQEKLCLFDNIMMSAMTQQSTFHCESQDNTSPSIHLYIPGLYLCLNQTCFPLQYKYKTIPLEWFLYSAYYFTTALNN